MHAPHGVQKWRGSRCMYLEIGRGRARAARLLMTNVRNRNGLQPWRRTEAWHVHQGR